MSIHLGSVRIFLKSMKSCCHASMPCLLYVRTLHQPHLQGLGLRGGSTERLSIHPDAKQSLRSQRCLRSSTNAALTLANLSYGSPIINSVDRARSTVSFLIRSFLQLLMLVLFSRRSLSTARGSSPTLFLQRSDLLWARKANRCAAGRADCSFKIALAKR